MKIVTFACFVLNKEATFVEIYKIYSYYGRKYLSHRHLQPELIGIYVNP
ncbi:hypothetical protein M094_3991 [Bacteroides uniformis str. 3978 T3 ii]|uniref:Uncharacterized protein n=1 Tax=Bacteroides uniformis str. 3978 T3 ii TaxID=1339349 RepID=A0A078S5G7_BACUN|nr:hypothetical protein M094_3991 [Bacteroides uniformis str. 3978 T3 ii]